MGKKIIKLLVHVPDSKSFGDPSALLKLYNILNDQYSDQLDIKMIFVVKKDDGAQLESLFTGGENYSTIDPFEFTESKNERDKFDDILNDAELLISFPTPHFLNEDMVIAINAHRKLLTVSMMEYNGDLQFYLLKNNFRPFPLPHGCQFWNSGPGDGNLGFIFEDITKKTAIHEADKKKLEDLQSSYWFGYSNIDNSLDCSMASPANFISFAALTDTEKDIKICVRMHANEDDTDNINIKPEAKLSHLKTREFAQTLDQYNCVCLHYDDSKEKRYIIYNKETVQDPPENVNMVAREVKKEEFERFLKTADKSILIKNPFPVKRDTMIALMRDSQKVNLVTGDQSLSECLSLGKIPFYQTMVWKQLLYTQLVKAAGKYECHYLKEWFELLGNKFDNSISKSLNQNSLKKSLVNLHNDLKKEPKPIKEIARFYNDHKDKLSEEIIRFSEELKISENMSTKIGPQILAFLNTDTKKRFEMFLDSVKTNPDYYHEFFVSDDLKRVKSHLKYYLKYDAPSAEQKIQQKEMREYFLKIIGSEVTQRGRLASLLFMLAELRRELQLDKLASVSTEKQNIILECLKHLPIFANPKHPRFPPNLKMLLNCLEFIDYDKFDEEQKKEFLKAISDWQGIRIDNSSDCDALSDLILNMVKKDADDADLIKAGLKLLFTTPCNKTDQSIFLKLSPEIRSQCIGDIAKTKHGMEYLIKLLFVKPLIAQHYTFYQPQNQDNIFSTLLNSLDADDPSFLKTEVLKLKKECNPEDTRLFEAIKEFEKAYKELPAPSSPNNRNSQL